MTDFLVVGAIVSIALVGGVGLGMLVARRLDRLIDHDEEPGDD
jgi:hypothetical protein